MAALAMRSIDSFPAGTPAAANVTLLVREGDVGRSSAIQNGYRPQLKFSANPEEISCELSMPATTPQLSPGGSLDVSLRCTGEIRAKADQLGFDMLEGGRKVGMGKLRR
jgi:translation elongation factor EF-Tu-like GTPase